LQNEALSIFAPMAGNITEILAIKGNYTNKGDILFRMTKNEQQTFTTYLLTANVKIDLSVGQQTTIVFDDKERVDAEIVKIYPHPQLNNTTPLLLTSDDQETIVELKFIQPVKQKLMDGTSVTVLL
jgi:HlyD family secretion protein